MKITARTTGITIWRRWRARISFSYWPLHSMYDPSGSRTRSETTRRACSTKPPTSRPRTLRSTVTTRRPFSLEIIEGPATGRMSASWASGTWVPFGAVTSTLPIAARCDRYCGA